MSITDELRRMLDERGVEWSSPSGLNSSFADSITYIGNVAVVSEIEGSDLLRINFDGTPEQAIEATLGRGTCHIKDGKCDQCGAIIRDKAVAFLTPTRQGIRMVEKYDASYCPNCGRRVVAGDAE